MGGACSPFEQQRVFSHPRCRGHPSICDCCGIKYLFKFPFVTVPFMTNIVQIMGKGPSPYLSAALIKNNWKHLREVSREDPSLRWWSVVNSRSSPVMNLSVAGLFEWKKRVMWCEINAVKRKYLCPSLIWCLAWTDDISNLNCLVTICLKPGTRTLHVFWAELLRCYLSQWQGHYQLTISQWWSVTHMWSGYLGNDTIAWLRENRYLEKSYQGPECRWWEH